MCLTCGHINPNDSSRRCKACWLLLTRVSPISQDQAATLAPRKRRHWLLRKAWFVSISVAIACLVCAQTIYAFDIVPRVFPPPAAISNDTPNLAPHNWAQGGRTAEGSRYTSSDAPVPHSVKWTFNTARRMLASPSVVDEQVYLNSNDGRMLALDSETGRLVWEYQTGSRTSSSPAILNDLVIFAVRSGLVTALDRNTGELVWETDLDSPVYASPTIGDGTVFLGSGASKLFALDAQTGQIRWDSPTRDWVVASAAYADDTVVVTSQGSIVDIFDTKNGRRRLKYDTGKVRFGGAPTIQDDQVYFSSDGGRVWGIDRYAQTYPLERFIFHVKINLYVWKLIPGRPVQRGSIWSKRVGGHINLPLAVTDDAVFGATENGVVFSRESRTGKEIWSTDVQSIVGVAPSIAANTVLLGTKDGNILGIDSKTGEILWRFHVGSAITTSPITAGDTIYVGTEDGSLHAIIGNRR